MSRNSPSSSATLSFPQNMPTALSARKRALTTNTIPLYNSHRQKPRRWPLVLRFYKGAIHGAVFLPVVLHSLFTAFIVYLAHHHLNIRLPASIIPSLSLVVGLMLVFRNQTAYDRFWTGRNLVTECCSCVRNLSRSFMVSSGNVEVTDTPPTEIDESFMSSTKDLEFEMPSPLQRADTEKVVKVLIAILFAIKHNLRNEYLATADGEPIDTSSHPELEALLPSSLQAVECRGVSLPLHLMVIVEAYIRRCVHRKWVNHPQSSQLNAQLNALTSAWGKLETIQTTPIPVPHLIHTKQVLALYGALLPFTLVNGSGWWSIPMVAVLMFTLYGIDCIGADLEDPFGYDRADIKMDAIIEDARVEILVFLDMWKDELASRGNDYSETIFD